MYNKLRPSDAETPLGSILEQFSKLWIFRLLLFNDY